MDSGCMKEVDQSWLWDALASERSDQGYTNPDQIKKERWLRWFCDTDKGIWVRAGMSARNTLMLGAQVGILTPEDSAAQKVRNREMERRTSLIAKRKTEIHAKQDIALLEQKFLHSDMNLAYRLEKVPVDIRRRFHRLQNTANPDEPWEVGCVSTGNLPTQQHIVTGFGDSIIAIVVLAGGVQGVHVVLQLSPRTGDWSCTYQLPRLNTSNIDLGDIRSSFNSENRPECFLRVAPSFTDIEVTAPNEPPLATYCRMAN